MNATDELSVEDAAKEVAAKERVCEDLRKKFETVRIAHGNALKELREARDALELKVAELVDRS